MEHFDQAVGRIKQSKTLKNMGGAHDPPAIVTKLALQLSS
jgi:hypothetical protein